MNNEELLQEAIKPSSNLSNDSDCFHPKHSYISLSKKINSKQLNHYIWHTSYFKQSRSHSTISEALNLPNSIETKKRKATPIPNERKDEAYWSRRKKNNESAQRSREARRLKEEQTTSRVLLLEKENFKLKTEVDLLREELEKLRDHLFNNRPKVKEVGCLTSNNACCILS